MLFGQVSLPPSDQPGDLWSRITAPLQTVLAGFWWFALHIVVPGALIVGVILLIAAGVTGNKQGMQRARGGLVAIPMALILAGIAVLVANWAVGAYA